MAPHHQPQQNLARRVVDRYLRRLVYAAEIPRKGKKYHGSFHGNADGKWWLGGYLEKADWDAALSLSNQNAWRHLSVDGATEHHPGFRRALKEMVHEYPELIDFIISFDGPAMPVAKLVGANGPAERAPNWHTMTFFHGTSSWAADKILREGLRPRAATNVNPAYGVNSLAGAGRADAIYLTTQLGMAHFAAMDAAKSHKGYPVVLVVSGVDGKYVAADEDSRQTDAAKSLAKLGSIAYLAPIAASKIVLHQRMEDREWVDV